jgi:hypothetical protein
VDKSALRSDDELQAVQDAVDAALRRGLSPTRIGQVAGDSMFVAKLRRGHPFKPDTLRRAHNAIRILLLPPPVPAFLEDHE